MGRPRKVQEGENVNMEKEENSVIESVALGSFQDPVSGAWNIVTLKFNGLTKEAVVDSLLDVGNSKDAAREQFKISAVEKGLV